MSRGDALDAHPFLPLFVPGDRLDRLANARASGAGAVIVDWEDALAPPGRPAARAALAGHEALAADGVPVLVRISAQRTPDHSIDVAALAGIARIHAVMLAKAESVEALEAVSQALGGRPVIALIETPLGLARARDLARASARLAFGSLDYATALRARHAPESLSLARQELVLASALAGRPGPLDGVTTALDDPEAVLRDAERAAALGFGGKLLVHPRQVAPAREGFAPSPEDVARAERIAAAVGTGAAAVALDGAMVDPPVIAWAEDVLGRARGG